MEWENFAPDEEDEASIKGKLKAIFKRIHNFI